MNKIQYIKLLELRGITKLNGITIGEAVRQSGGEPSEHEMVKVNEESMKYFMEQLEEEKNKNEELTKQITNLQKRCVWLDCLESAGVDNWEGIDVAREIFDNDY